MYLRLDVYKRQQEIRKRYKVKVPGNALVNETSAQMDAYRAAIRSGDAQ